MVMKKVEEFLNEEYCYGYTTPSFREMGVSYFTRRLSEMGMKIPEKM